MDPLHPASVRPRPSAWRGFGEKPFTREITARIRTVDRVIDSAAGTFGVIVDLDNAKQELPGGIRCKLAMPALTK